MENITDGDKALVLSLVHAHVCNTPEYSSWVNSYSTIRKLPPVAPPHLTPTTQQRIGRSRVNCYMLRVGGHYRRKALYRMLLSALKCTCKFNDISLFKYTTPPTHAVRIRRREDGSIVPRGERVLEWV